MACREGHAGADREGFGVCKKKMQRLINRVGSRKTCDKKEERIIMREQETKRRCLLIKVILQDCFDRQRTIFPNFLGRYFLPATESR